MAGKFREQPVLNTLLVALCIAVIVLADTAIGPASQSGGQSTRTTTVKRGVVQSTVSGSGNVQSADQLNLGFKTSGTVTHIYVKEGQHVTQGQLLATLDPKSAEVTLEQAKATLQSAEANLAKLEETEGETTSSRAPPSRRRSAQPPPRATSQHDLRGRTTPTQTSPQPTTTTTGTGSPTTTTGTTTTPTTTTTTPATKTTPTSPASSRNQAARQARRRRRNRAPRQSSSARVRAPRPNRARRRAKQISPPPAAVKSDKLTVQSDEQAVQNTKLYAPESGTIVSLSGEVGETVSGTGTTRASSSTSSS